MVVSESKIEKQVVNYLKKQSIWAVKMSLTSENGFPDRLCIGYDHIFFIELKAPGKTPRPLQKFIHEKLRGFGFDVLVIDDKKQIIDYINGLKNGESKKN